MGAVLLDTTVLIDLLRQRPNTVARYAVINESDDRVLTSAINIEEVVRGLRPEEISATRALFLGLRIQPITEREAWLAGEWRRNYGQAGTTLTQSDCLVAAAASTSNAVLITGNPKHFPMTDSIALEHWRAGE